MSKLPLRSSLAVIKKAEAPTGASIVQSHHAAICGVFRLPINGLFLDRSTFHSSE